MNGRGRFFATVLACGLLAYTLGFSFFVVGWSPGPNYRNVTIDTHVNITGSVPIPLTFYFVNPVTLSAGTGTTVFCNVSVRDYNGFGDIDVLNATLFHSTSTLGAANDNNTHYSNSSCSPIAGQASGIYKNYSCSFEVAYHALNGTWNCTAFANDTTGFVGNGSSTFAINALYALNITPTLIDYGTLGSAQYSNNITANISNIGNLNINISVQGYGQTPGDNLSFVCDTGNLTVGVQHFASNSTANYSEKQTLTGSLTRVNLLTINKTTNASYSINSTYWEMWADPGQNAFGNCTGFIVFQAEAP